MQIRKLVHQACAAVAAALGEDLDDLDLIDLRDRFVFAGRHTTIEVLDAAAHGPTIKIEGLRRGASPRSVVEVDRQVDRQVAEATPIVDVYTISEREAILAEAGEVAGRFQTGRASAALIEEMTTRLRAAFPVEHPVLYRWDAMLRHERRFTRGPK